MFCEYDILFKAYTIAHMYTVSTILRLYQSIGTIAHAFVTK
ncbi:MAG TPA: hypothetical protein PLV62_10745 [Spirochaetota bacterium]|nr:hypothetical protein [Spirochaetota bacterium]HQG43044.1 hypothetical protein [Spirochaetota bacterium]